MNKNTLLIIGVVLLVMMVGLVAYNNILQEPVLKEKTFAKIAPEHTPEVKEALAKQKEQEIGAGEVITDGQTTVVTKSLPPAAQDFVSELDKIKAELAEDIKQEPVETLSDTEVAELISEADALISKMDAEHNLGTREFLNEMLDTVPKTNDPELLELDTEMEGLEREAEDILRGLQ